MLSDFLERPKIMKDVAVSISELNELFYPFYLVPRYTVISEPDANKLQILADSTRDGYRRVDGKY